MKLFGSVLMMFAASASPFDSCGNAWSSKLKQDQANQPAQINECPTDPPDGCGAACLTPDLAAAAGEVPAGGAWLTPYCSGSYAGDLTKLFANDAQTILVCDTEAMGGSYLVFPPYFQITPTVVQTGAMCVAPPLPPDSIPFKDLMGP